MNNGTFDPNEWTVLWLAVMMRTLLLSEKNFHIQEAGESSLYQKGKYIGLGVSLVNVE